MAPLGIALIGSGIFAKEEHLPAIQAVPELLSLKAIYSRSSKSASALGQGLSGVDLYSEDAGEGREFETLLKREDVVGVIIALPIPVQPDYIRRALLAGKHVLAEKPIAKDIATATDLLDWYNSSIKNSGGPSFSIAENFRFLDSFSYGAEQVSSLGRILGFKTVMHTLVSPGGKYFETAWRKVPEYQGGFLLDGGVHFIAATRLLLGEEAAPVRTSAFSVQLQKHLPPVDTLNATLLLKNGSSGTLSLSFGTTFTGSEYAVAAEKGIVKVSRGKVTVTKDGKDVIKDFPEEGNGVKQEVKAWATSLAEGQPDVRQAPEEALKDLILLEKSLKSSEHGGTPQDLR